MPGGVEVGWGGRLEEERADHVAHGVFILYETRMARRGATVEYGARHVVQKWRSRVRNRMLFSSLDTKLMMQCIG